ncbi:MAG: ABC transporter substrate-binding protein [Planctomycetota bacterium]
MKKWILGLLISFCLVMPCQAEQSFKELVGPYKVGNVKSLSPINTGFILFGADIATFYANGGLKTQSDTIFAKQGLDLNLVPGDDFVQQVRDYMEGKTPFLRGTFRMIGMASEVLNSDPRTEPVMIVHLTYSLGDHMVVRPDIREIKDLKGKKIVFQRPGPHDGMVYDILESGQLDWDEVTIITAKDLFGTPDSPAEIFKRDKSIAACCVVTPDMIALTGGLQNTGTGAEGTIKGARVLVSTAELSYSIADVYVCRKDFYDQHRDLVIKFTSGLLKAQEEVLDLKNKYESTGSAEYMKLMKLTQKIYGKDVIPTLEEDAHGLLSDCTFVGHPGNVAFFSNENPLRGFNAFHEKAMNLATGRGYASTRQKIQQPTFDWNSSSFTKFLKKTGVSGTTERYEAEAVIGEIESLTAGGALDEKTIWSFDINFKPNQTEFAANRYDSDYARVIRELNKYGNAVIAIRGHACPAKTLLHFVRGAIEAGELSRTGNRQNGYRYFMKNGQELKLANTQQVLDMIDRLSMNPSSEWAPREIMQAALNLSRKRSEEVRKSIIQYAKTQNLVIDPSQIQPVGVGVREPLIPVPNQDNADVNRRVEFRLVRVTAEAVKESDFDF